MDRARPARRSITRHRPPTRGGASATASSIRRCARGSASSSGTCRSSRAGTRTQRRARSSAPPWEKGCSAPLCLPRETVARDAPPIRALPRASSRAGDGHREAASLFARERGRRKLTTSLNARKIPEAREPPRQAARPLVRKARAFLRISKSTSLDEWLAHLPEHASEPAGAAHLASVLRGALGPEEDPGPPLTFEATRTRSFEEHLWRSIAALAEGQFRQKENADGIAVNRGKSGGPAAKAARLEVAERRDLELLGDHLHARYRDLAAHHGMQGRAEPMDHVFTWETDFDFPWSDGWSKNQDGQARERNIVFVIPGKNRKEAVIMGDHYDTAYMEDVYEPGRGGDGLRAPACGADDNHSATTALLLAADVLLPLSRDGKLERDVWLVHLTGEEFPSDCLGARNLAEAFVERRLAFTKENGDIAVRRVRRSRRRRVRPRHDRAQLGPRQGRVPDRARRGGRLSPPRRDRAPRERALEPRRIRVEPRSGPRKRTGRASSACPTARRHPFALRAPRAQRRSANGMGVIAPLFYNTDGQIFSDVGVPVVLFYGELADISRSGYHDTHDTMKNIDLDYAAALTAIADRETVAGLRDDARRYSHRVRPLAMM